MSLYGDAIVKGDGATCAFCGESPGGRFSIGRSYIIWACSEEHAKKAFKAIATKKAN